MRSRFAKLLAFYTGFLNEKLGIRLMHDMFVTVKYGGKFAFILYIYKISFPDNNKISCFARMLLAGS